MQKTEIPLGIQAHRLAGQFAAEQTTKEKSKQVYLNTLAVYAVHRYLKWLGIETNLSQSDCWNPILRNRWNVADLVIPDIGKLECRPVLPGETTVSLPPEVTEERIGYLAIQFSDRLDKVQLLGFTKTPVAEVLEISRLGSFDELIDVISPTVIPLPTVKPLKLEDLEKLFDETWQPVEPVLTIRGIETQEDEIERVKRIDLGLLVDRQQVDLVATISLEENQEVRFLFRVRPTEKNEFLPPGLKLKVILESDSEEVEAQEADSWIQLALTELPGKLITVQISLGDESVTEEFVA